MREVCFDGRSSYVSASPEVCFDRTRVMFRPCPVCVSTVLEVYFDQRSSMFRASLELCFDHARSTINRASIML